MSIPRDGLSRKLSDFIASNSWQNDVVGNGTCQLIMLRGCKINADGSLSQHGDPLVYTDRYDDVMIAYGLKTGGQPFLECFKATAKPGWAWIKHPSYASSNAGCPTVQPGQYAYVRGDHRGHEAMRQAYRSPVCVIRDLDDDMRLEPSDRVDYPWDTGINIHAGGVSERVGLNSSGCQVLWGGWEGQPWQTFYSLIYSVARRQSVFHYCLADFGMFAEWHDRGPTSHVMFGSSGKFVTAVQNTLVAEGYLGSKQVNGKWDEVTDRAVRKWQKAEGKQPNGIVTL